MTQAEAVDDTPPAAKLVYKVLEHADEPLRHGEIADETRLAERTVGESLRRLRDVGVVERDPDTNGDARGYVYYLSTR